jgi:hypothetical protein
LYNVNNDAWNSTSNSDLEDNIDDIDDLIDATPSGEVQMRVKGGLNIGRSGTPMRDSRAEIDTERLTKELAEHREAEKRILGLLESQSCDESQLVTCGEHRYPSCLQLV